MEINTHAIAVIAYKKRTKTVQSSQQYTKAAYNQLNKFHRLLKTLL